MEILHEVARGYENKPEDWPKEPDVPFSIKGIEKSKRRAKELITRNTKPNSWWEAHFLKHQPSGPKLWLLLLLSSPLTIMIGKARRDPALCAVVKHQLAQQSHLLYSVFRSTSRIPVAAVSPLRQAERFSG